MKLDIKRTVTLCETGSWFCNLIVGSSVKTAKDKCKLCIYLFILLNYENMKVLFIPSELYKFEYLREPFSQYVVLFLH